MSQKRVKSSKRNSIIQMGAAKNDHKHIDTLDTNSQTERKHISTNAFTVRIFHTEDFDLEVSIYLSALIKAYIVIDRTKYIY